MKFIISIFISIFFGVFADNNNNDFLNLSSPIDNSFLIKAKINNAEIWQAENCYYTSKRNTVKITAINKKMEILFLSFHYEIGEKMKLNSESYFYYQDSMYAITKGQIIFEELATGTANGSFEFIAKNLNDSKSILNITKGEFNEISNENYNEINNNKYRMSKVMELNLKKGKIKTENTEVEIRIGDNEIKFNYIKNSKQSYLVNIKKTKTTSTLIIYYANDRKIEKITTDLIKNNETTIWYKNGNTISYFK